MMKKSPVVFLAMATLGLAMTGCNTSARNQSADTLATDTTIGASAADTLVTKPVAYTYYSADSTVQSTILVDCPTADDSLSRAVMTFIGKQLGSLYVPYSYSEEAEALKQYPRYKGDMLQMQQVVDYYGKGATKYLKSVLSDMAGEGRDELPQVCSDVKIRKVAETSTYLTYAMSTYSAVGGAHGSYTSYNINISKLTDKPIEKAIDASRTRALQKILQKGIEHYFKECGEADFQISSIQDYLDPTGENGSSKLIPLPQNTPYIENDSLCFVYQQYEIAPYAAGLVSFNVALKEIKPYLRKEVQDLIKDE